MLKYGQTLTVSESETGRLANSIMRNSGMKIRKLFKTVAHP